MENGKTRTHEVACDRVAARFSERWLRSYVRRKLRSDPVFPAAFELLRDSSELLVDVGCGIGLLGFYLRERGLTMPIVGLDADPRKIGRARAASSRGCYANIDFETRDVREFVRQRGNFVLFDLLHYLDPGEQAQLLAQLVRQIAPGRLLAVRDCPRDGSTRFRLTYWAERFAQLTTWNLPAALHFPRRESICAPFSPNEFQIRVAPLWGRTPFNNHLFIFARLPKASLG